MTNNAELLHDLRMPLQLVTSCAQLLEREVGENERALGYVQMLLGSVREMQKMLVGALEPMRPDSGALKLDGCDLIGLTWETCARCRLYAQRRDIQLSFHANIDRLELLLDEEKYVRILLNLLSNALKFTPEGGEVRVIVRRLGDFVEIDVCDNGCGIEQERLERVFELHETDGGYGYGLYIARQYACLMGGTLTVESAPGLGSTFTLRLCAT